MLHDLYNSKKNRQISVSSAVQFVQHKLCQQEISPDWIEAIYQQKVEPKDKTIDFNLERQKILANLGQSETL